MINKTMVTQTARSVFGIVLLTTTYSSVYSQTPIIFPPAATPSVSENQIAIASEPNWINCDAFDNGSTSAPLGHAIAIVWDEVIGGVPRCSLYVYDNVSGFSYKRLVAMDARHPDVAIVEHDQGANVGNPGYFAISVVYEDLSVSPAKIGFTYFDVADFFLVGPSHAVSNLHGPWTLDASFGEGKYPHIDALPDDLVNNPYFVSPPLAGYVGLNNFVVTWTEENINGNKKIYVEDGFFSSTNLTLNNNITYIADGEMSDIAGVRSQNFITPATTRLCHIIYRDGSDLNYVEYDIDQPMISSPVTLESGTIADFPRIDAACTEAQNNLNHTRWVAVSGIDLGLGNNVVHIYTTSGNIQVEDYCPFNPTPPSPCTTYVSGSQGTIPCVATGPGSAFVTAADGLGYNKYQLAYFLDVPSTFYENVAMSYEVGSSDFGGVFPINSTATNSAITTPKLGVGVSSTFGVGYVAAWNNRINSQNYIYWKNNDFSSHPTYKPGRPNSVGNIERDMLSIHPNPTSNQVSVKGVTTTATYNITDITGRTLLQGTLTHKAFDIDLSFLTNGLYIININQNNEQQQFKLVKQ